MARELHSGNERIEQLDPVPADYVRKPEIQLVDNLDDPEYAERLRFNEDPVTIRIEESTQENAPLHYLVQVNGKGAEVLVGDKWFEFKHLPVGQQIVTKRKYLEVLLRAKQTRVSHFQDEPAADFSRMNEARRVTSAMVAVSIIHDPSPKAHAWMQEMTRRNF